MREKQKIAGMWINAASAHFRSAPSYYAMASSRPIADIVDERTAAIYELGLGKLQLSPSSLNATEEIQRFQSGLVDLRRRSEEHTSELQSLMRISYAVFCLKKKTQKQQR